MVLTVGTFGGFRLESNSGGAPRAGGVGPTAIPAGGEQKAGRDAGQFLFPAAATLLCLPAAAAGNGFGPAPSRSGIGWGSGVWLH